ncbi:unnamed protein product [Diabrotica balteata]|uniref:beta-glucosidase n=1 Tax=Diabrotica balteata TaxID=107213 RepID=A0A9P0GU55_DIABA|nr:unnamed protein product [Diabrotica balteata]
MSNSEDQKRFPEGFLFGTASSAYQIEGGYNADGKGESVYDYYTHKRPEKFHNGSNGDVACDSYHKWHEDVKILKDLGVNFYRFSISWSRILPTGYSNKINEEGVKYYENLIDGLLKNGIEPMVTLYHWDLPMPIQELGGWTNIKTAEYFEDYARIVFERFGNKVKYWITFNTTLMGYADSEFPPFINQPGISSYMCTYVTLLAHARVFRIYQNEFKQYKGQVGIVVDARWYQPGSDSNKDAEAANRVLEFEIGIWLHPLLSPKGDFPEIVKERVAAVSSAEGYRQSRLPKFSATDINLLKGSVDFVGLNLYTSHLVEHVEDEHFKDTSTIRDEGARLYQDASWKGSKSTWLKVHPEGARKILNWVKEKYNNPVVFITENGFSDDGEIEDNGRIEYLQGYLTNILQAIHEDKVDVKGYAVWSLLDNFEWASGYSEKFGLYQVDFNDPGRKRYPKKSALWYKNVIKNKQLP